MLDKTPDTAKTRRLTRQQLRATDFGRSKGWNLELEGHVVAHLDEPRWEDMFWVSYRLTPTTDDEALAAELLSTAFWMGPRWERMIFRSCALGVAAPHPLPAIQPFVAPGRLNVRALYLTLDSSDAASGKVATRPPGWAARLVAWIRRR